MRSSSEEREARAAVTAWAGPLSPLCSPYVWPRPPHLRCQRDQTRLLDPAASAHRDYRAEGSRAPEDLCRTGDAEDLDKTGHLVE
jgi:hypothetical protein